VSHVDIFLKVATVADFGNCMFHLKSFSYACYFFVFFCITLKMHHLLSALTLDICYISIVQFSVSPN